MMVGGAALGSAGSALATRERGLALRHHALDLVDLGAQSTLLFALFIDLGSKVVELFAWAWLSRLVP